MHKLIEAVYEPHYDHYAKYFGNTLAGFFSDEPGFDAPHFGMTGYDTGIYNRSVGQPGVMLPWRDAARRAHGKRRHRRADALSADFVVCT